MLAIPQGNGRKLPLLNLQLPLRHKSAKWRSCSNHHFDHDNNNNHNYEDCKYRIYWDIDICKMSRKGQKLPLFTQLHRLDSAAISHVTSLSRLVPLCTTIALGSTMYLVIIVVVANIVDIVNAIVAFDITIINIVTFIIPLSYCFLSQTQLVQHGIESQQWRTWQLD